MSTRRTEQAKSNKERRQLWQMVIDATSNLRYFTTNAHFNT